MRRIAHLSDLHFGATDPEVVAALAADLAADPPDLVIVSGDLTMRARRREFREARRFLERLPAPVLAVPGNHDVPPFQLVERFVDPFGAWRRELGRETEWHWQDAELGIIGLNTARRWGSAFDWSQGRVSRGALARLSARLAALPPGLFRIVVAHHPFLPPPQAPGLRLVGGAERALDAFLAHGVRMVLSGHFHLGYVRDDHRAKLAAPEVGEAVTAARRLLVVQAATATSIRLRGEPNAYNRITVEDGMARVEPRIWTGQGWEGGDQARPSRSASGSASAESPAIAQNPAPPKPA